MSYFLTFNGICGWGESRFKKSVYALQNGFRRPFGGMDVLLALNYSLKQVVHVSNFVISHIPEGPVMTKPFL